MNTNEPFDIDNMDIEEQINELDDMIESENEARELDDKEIETSCNDLKKIRNVLNVKNLLIDLSIKNEDQRSVYIFKKDDKGYKGYVVHQIDKNTFIFNVKEYKEANATYKLKKFDIRQIKQLTNRRVVK